MQEEKTGYMAERARGTVKSAMLKNDGNSHDLIVASCYDQKTFYMLSHWIEEITWVVCEKKAHSQALIKSATFKFLWFNLSHDYNFEMNDHDVADQLQLVFCFIRFQQNINWWWVMWLWRVEVSLVNS